MQKSHKAYLDATIACMASLLYGVCTTSLTGLKEIMETTEDAGTVGFWQPRMFVQGEKLKLLSSGLSLGSLFAPFLYDFWKGKTKHFYVVLSVVYGLGALFILSLYNYWFVLTGRLLLGIGIGLTAIVMPPYLFSIAPEGRRAQLTILHPLTVVVGVLIGQIFGLIFNEVTNWRMTYFFIMAIVIIQCIGAFAIQDVAIPKKSSKITALGLLKNPEARRSLLTMLVIHMAQQTSGNNAILLYAKEILSKSANVPKYGSIYLGISKLFSSIFAIYVVNLTGRRIVLTLSCLICIVSLIMLARDIAPAWGLAVFGLGYHVGLGSIVWAMTVEIFPPEYKVTATKVAVFLNRTVAFAATQLFPTLQELMGRNVFYVFVTFMVGTIIYTWTMVKETRKQTPKFQ